MIMEKEKEQIQIKQMGQQPTQISHADWRWVTLIFFNILRESVPPPPPPPILGQTIDRCANAPINGLP